MEPTKDPTIWTWAMAIMMALLGGAVKYLQKIKRNNWRWSWKDAVVDLAASSLAGLVTMLLCQGAGINPYTAGAFAGIAGHYGSRALALIWERRPL